MPMYKITVDKCGMPSVDFTEVFYKEAKDFESAINGVDEIKSVEEIGQSWNEFVRNQIPKHLVHTKK